MKTCILALLLIPALSTAAPDPDCQKKLDYYSESGVKPEALEQALRATDPGTPMSRYLLLAEVGTEAPPNPGYLSVLDRTTGLITNYKVRTGYAENGDRPSDHPPATRTYFGSSQLDKNMVAKPVSPMLEKKLKENGSANAPLKQDLAPCAGKEANTGNICMSAEDYRELKAKLWAEKKDEEFGHGSKQILFVYPKKGLQRYLATRGPQSPRDVCRYLKDTPLPQRAPGAPGGPKKGLDGG